MFAIINNRGAQIGVFDTQEEAQEGAEAYNTECLDVFAWVAEAEKVAEPEDIPGRGLIYG